MDQTTTNQTVFQTLADKGRHSWWRYLVTVLLAFLVQAIVLIGGVITGVAVGFPADTLAKSIQDPGQPVLFFSAIGLSFAGLLAGFSLGGMWLHKKSFADYVGRWRFRGFALGFAVWLVVLLIDVAIGYVLRPTAFRISGAVFNPAMTGLICASLAVQTFTEEFIFRGYISQGLLKLIRRPLPTAIVSGLIFGALHIPNGWPQTASATMLGIGLTLIAIRTGSLAFGYGLHLINNVFGAVIVVSGGDVFKGSPGLIMQNAPDLIAVDVGVVAVALVVIVAATYRRGAARPELAGM